MKTDIDFDPFNMGSPSATEDRTLSLEDYLARPELSRSDLWAIHDSGPYAWNWRRTREPREETDAMRLGTAVHTAILEPERFDSSVVAYAARRSGALWDAFQAEHAGKTILTAEQYQRAGDMRDYVLGCPKLRRLFEDGGTQEVSIFWTVSGVGLKARPDWLDVPRARIVDLKTTSDLDDWALMRSAKRYGYHVQGAMFLDACAELGADVRDVWLLYVLSSGAPACKLRRLPDEAIAEGRAIYLAALETYQACQRSGVWAPPPIEPADLYWETRT